MIVSRLESDEQARQSRLREARSAQSPVKCVAIGRAEPRGKGAKVGTRSNPKPVETASSWNKPRGSVKSSMKVT